MFEAPRVMEQAGALEFLSKTVPFQFLGTESLRRLAEGLSEETYASGTVILRQGGEPGRHLYIIRKGGVKVVMGLGAAEEIVIDRRGEGDCFGFLSLLGQDRSRADVLAVEETTCYLLERPAMLQAMEGNAAFTEYFLKSFLTKFVDRTCAEMKGKGAVSLGGNGQLYTVAVGEMVRREPITAPSHISIAGAAALMSRHRISSLIIMDETGVPVGIVTDRDFRDKVLGRGRSAEDPVSSVMSVSLIKVEAAEYAFEALLKMLHYGIHHLVVVEEGRLLGIVTNHDFMIMQGNSPIAVAREMESQHTLEGLSPVARKVGEIVVLMLREGAHANNITHVISELNDRLLRRVLEIVEKKVGPAPCPYSFIVFGSEGRHEQTFKTDQDNALIYADPRSEAEALARAEYFGLFSRAVTEALMTVGFPRCPGNYMASNPKWCQPLSVWKRYFADWIMTPTPEAVLQSEIFFDFRNVGGDPSLAASLRQSITQRASANALFLKHMAEATLAKRPPLGFFGRFQVERDGAHKDKLDIKTRCLAILVDLARLFSLEGSVEETSTLGRLRALRGHHPVVDEHGAELEAAYEFAMLLRMHHQAACLHEGREPDNYLDPETLGALESKSLKETCALLARVQDSVDRKYNPGLRL